MDNFGGGSGTGSSDSGGASSDSTGTLSSTALPTTGSSSEYTGSSSYTSGGSVSGSNSQSESVTSAIISSIISAVSSGIISSGSSNNNSSSSIGSSSNIDSSSSIGNSSSTNSSSSSSGHIDSSGSSGSGSFNGLCYDWISVFGLKVYDPLLVPLCLWALYIGVTRFKLFKKYNCTYLYSVTFLMYGIMMTFAMLADSLSRNFSTKIADFVTTMDVDLTSTVGTFFLYCGLSDVNWINPKESKTKLILLFNSLILLCCWVYGINFSPTKYRGLWFLTLYDIVVGISCGLYLIFQIAYLVKRKNLKSILWLLAAGLTGGIGLSITVDSAKWCEHFGAHFSSSYAWFFLSDVAMLLISKYVIVSRSKDLQEPSFYNNNNGSIKYQPINQSSVYPASFKQQPQPINNQILPQYVNSNVVYQQRPIQYIQVQPQQHQQQQSPPPTQKLGYYIVPRK